MSEAECDANLRVFLRAVDAVMGVDLPQATRLPKSQLADFKQYTAPLLTQLKTLSHTHIARVDEAADDASRPN